jgi:hypothetical protein
VDGWDYKASADAVEALLARLYVLAEAHWRVTVRTPGKVHVRVSGGEKGASWCCEVSFQGYATDSVVSHRNTLFAAMQDAAGKLKDDRELCPDFLQTIEWKAQEHECRESAKKSRAK